MSSRASNWSLLVPVAERDPVLDVAGDGGETTRRLVKAGARVTALRSREQDCAALRAEGAEAVQVARLSEAAFDSGAYRAIIAAPGDVFRSSSRSSLELLASWLAPGGLLFLGLENPPWTWAAGRWLRRRFLGESLPPAAAGCWCRGTAGRLRSCGFGDVRIYGVFPSRSHTKFLVPLGEPEVERYFLNSMVGGSSVKARAARGLARMAVASGVLDQLIPAYEVVACRLEAS